MVCVKAWRGCGWDLLGLRSGRGCLLCCVGGVYLCSLHVANTEKVSQLITGEVRECREVCCAVDR